MKNTTFVDANIVLELLLPNRTARQAVFTALSDADQLAVSTLTIHVIWYFGRKYGATDAAISMALDDYEVLSLTATDYHWAKQHEQGKDFEDALQVAVALRSGCSQFLTLDRQLARRYTDLPLKFVIPSI